MKKLLIVLTCVAVLLPLAIWWYSPEQVIMRRTKHLMEVISMNEGRGPMRQAKVFSMNAMLAPDVIMETPKIPDANGIFTRQEIESGFSWICQNAKSSSFRITSFKSVEVSDERAKVEATAEGFMELRTTRPADGTFRISIDWVKSDDGWRFEKVLWKSI